MEDKLPRKLAAIFYADVVDYSRLTGEDEDATHRRLSEYLDLVSNIIGQYQGKVVHYAGDAVLADFSAVTNVLECATSIQSDISNRNLDLPDERKITFRIGINLGEVIVDRGDIYGNDVNIAARLESLADAGGVCVSEAVRNAIGNKLPLDYEFMGEQSVKNIKEPIRAYQVRLRSGKASKIVTTELPGLELPEEPSIAVLPFTNMSGDPEQEYFSDGITEDIITALSRIPRLFVVARNSTSIYKGTGVDIKQVGREQGVRFVLEGSVRKSGNQIRITAQLIDAITGNHRWAERYDRELDDIFTIQDEIAKSVTVAVQVELTAGEQARLWAGGTDNLEAWECMVRGNELMIHHGRGDNDEARRLAERALQLDPGYANAWVLAGYTHFEDALWGWSSSREISISTALEAAYKAIELQELNSDSYTLLAWVKCELAEFDEAVEAARKAVSLSPNNAQNVAMLAGVLARAGEYQEADQQIRRAIRLSPIYPAWYLHALGCNCFALDKNEESVSAFRSCVERLDPESSFMPIARVFLVICLAKAGYDVEAKTKSEEVFRHDPSFQIDDWWQFPRKDQMQRNRAVKIWNRIISL
jgi:adenylate cyclase